MNIFVPILIMVVVAVFLVVLRVIAMRENRKRRTQGLPPLTEETPIINVIDWTRRK